MEVEVALCGEVVGQEESFGALAGSRGGAWGEGAIGCFGGALELWVVLWEGGGDVGVTAAP